MNKRDDGMNMPLPEARSHQQDLALSSEGVASILVTLKSARAEQLFSPCTCILSS